MRRSPTLLAIRRASELGTAMARLDRGIAPALNNAHTYPTYVLFMQSHRLLLEQEKAFAPWEARLVELIEHEEKLTGERLDEVRAWDELHSGVAVPLRCAFWYGWETAVGLKRRYEQCVEAAKRAASERRVFHALHHDTQSGTEQTVEH